MICRPCLEAAAAALVLGLSGLALAQAIEFPGNAKHFPSAVLALSMALSLVWLVQSAIALHARASRPAAVASDGAALRRLLIVVAATILYVVATEFLGFLTATAVFVPLTAIALGIDRIKVIVPSAAVFVLGLYVLFDLVLRRPMPPEAPVRIMTLLTGGN